MFVKLNLLFILALVVATTDFAYDYSLTFPLFMRWNNVPNRYTSLYVYSAALYTRAQKEIIVILYNRHFIMYKIFAFNT